MWIPTEFISNGGVVSEWHLQTAQWRMGRGPILPEEIKLSWKDGNAQCHTNAKSVITEAVIAKFVLYYLRAAILCNSRACVSRCLTGKLGTGLGSVSEICPHVCLHSFILVSSLLTLRWRNTVFSHTNPSPISNLCFLNTKYSSNTQNNSRTYMTTTSGSSQRPSWQMWRLEGIFQPDIAQPFFCLCTLSCIMHRKPSRDGKTFMWLGCGFFSKNTLSSSMPQACKWVKVQFAF